MTARVARLLVYPVKSLDGQAVERAAVLPNGALEHDRAFALFDAEGRVVNAKRHAALQRLRTRVDLARRVVHLGDAPFDLDADRPALQDRLGAALGFAVTLAEDRDGGFPDDPVASGPTLIGQATLEAVADWFGLGVPDVRARFRANVEIEGVPAFWEDRLFGPGDGTVDFAIGDTRFSGINPCLRCIVPTRRPWHGEPDATFVRRFAALRDAHLPPWAARDRFRPFYRLAVNTRRSTVEGGDLRVGDAVVVGT